MLYSVVKQNEEKSSAVRSERPRWIHFADELGKELFQCKSLPDTPLGTPIFGSPLTRAINRVNGAVLSTVPSNNRISDLASDFRQNFTISDRHDFDVKLESAAIAKSDLLEFRGHIRVKPLSPRKTVSVRFTVNNWKSYENVKAHCLPKRRADGRETFSFLVGLAPWLTEPVEFCICCQYNMDSGVVEVWDNNGGSNYQFQKLQPNTPTIVLPSDINSNVEKTVWRSNGLTVNYCSNFSTL